MSLYSPMPFDCDLPTVFSLARSVAAELSCGPEVFIPGEGVVNALILELDALRRLCSASDGRTSGVDDSSLAAHLLPCRAALKNMLDIRQKYPGQTMGFGDSIKWKRDEKRFEKEVAVLRQATTQLRETSQLLQAAAVNSQSRAGSTTARGFQSHVSVSIAQGAPAISQVSLSRSSTASLQGMTGSQTPGDTATLPMCPRGSGCREPYCHQKCNHPGAPKCEDGRNCCKQDCPKWHPKSPHCHYGPNCPKIESGCTKAHPWPRVSQQLTGCRHPQMTETQHAQTRDGRYLGPGSSSFFSPPTLITGYFAHADSSSLPLVLK